MKAKALVHIRIGFYSAWTLATAWTTAMAGVKWDSMGWEEHSCLIVGIAAQWTGVMVAYFDKSLWKADEEEKVDRAKKVDPTPPIP